MLAHAKELVYTLKELMPTQYQKENLEAMLGLFLEAFRTSITRTLKPTFRTPTVTKGFLLKNFSMNRIKTYFGYLRSHIIGLFYMKFIFSIRSNKF